MEALQPPARGSRPDLAAIRTRVTESAGRAANGDRRSSVPGGSANADLATASRHSALELERVLHKLSTVLTTVESHGLDDHIMVELMQTLRSHAGRTRQAIEVERDLRHEAVARLQLELEKERATNARMRSEVDQRLAQAASAERDHGDRARAPAADLERALAAAEARASDEIDELKARHAREVEGLRARVRELEERLSVVPAGGAITPPHAAGQ